MSEVSALDTINAVRLEEGKLRYIKGPVTEAWIDLILTAHLDDQFERKRYPDPEKLYVIPDIHADEIREESGKLRHLWSQGLITYLAPSSVKANNRVFLDSKGVRIFEDLAPLLPQEKGMEVRKRRVLLMLKEFYGLSTSSIIQLTRVEEFASKEIWSDKPEEQHNRYVLPIMDKADELLNAGLVWSSLHSVRFHMTPKGWRLVSVMRRCNITAEDFASKKSGGALTLFSGGIVPSLKRSPRPPIDNPTDIDISRDGLLLTMSKLAWCWKHRNDPIDMSDIDLTLSPEVLAQQERLKALDNKIYDPGELEPIMTWTVEDQRKQNDDYWNAGQPFWLNPAAFDVGPDELPNYGAEPTPPPEWWTPRKPSTVKASTHMRDILAEAMKAPDIQHGEIRYNEEEGFKEIYDSNQNKWLVVRDDPKKNRQNKFTPVSSVFPQSTIDIWMADRKAEQERELTGTDIAIDRLIAHTTADAAAIFAKSKKLKLDLSHARHARLVFTIEYEGSLVAYRTREEARIFFKAMRFQKKVQEQQAQMEAEEKKQREHIHMLTMEQSDIKGLMREIRINEHENRPREKPVRK